MKKIILYHSNPLKFGGVDTFDYNFCKKLKDKYDITFLYKEGVKSTIDRLKDLGIDVQKYDSNKKYVCDVCILASAWGGYPETMIAKSGRYIQMVHADYEQKDLIDFEYHKWHKTTEHVGVSNQVCKSFTKLFPNEKITRIYNILDDKQETRPILKLVSATRLSKEKGYARMLELAESLKKNNIKFRWTVFTDLSLYNQKPFDMDEFVYMNPTRDIFDYIAEADYGVQLQEKQKVKVMYGLSEKQMEKTFVKAVKMKGVNGENLLKLLESRLDNLVYRIGFATTRKGARQLVNHGHITVNGKRVDIPSYQVKPGDVISLMENDKEMAIVKSSLEALHNRVEYISYDDKKMEGTYVRLPERSELNADIDEALIIEYYNRN